MWFLTVDPFVRISVFIAKLSERQYCWRVSRGLSLIVKNISNSLTYTMWPLHASALLHWPIMATVGLHDFVKVSISVEFKSFLLIMCIDAPESTTNARSSGIRFDAGKHLFCEGEKNAALFSPSMLEYFRPDSTLLHGHIALATLSLPETDAQILEHWGYADEDYLGKSHSKRWILVLNVSSDVPSAFVNSTHRIGIDMVELFRKIDEDFGGSIS